MGGDFFDPKLIIMKFLDVARDFCLDCGQKFF
jgi:hypothetical protein